jgi:hypothetical protein
MPNCASLESAECQHAVTQWEPVWVGLRAASRHGTPSAAPCASIHTVPTQTTRQTLRTTGGIGAHLWTPPRVSRPTTHFQPSQIISVQWSLPCASPAHCRYVDTDSALIWVGPKTARPGAAVGTSSCMVHDVPPQPPARQAPRQVVNGGAAPVWAVSSGLTFGAAMVTVDCVSLAISLRGPTVQATSQIDHRREPSPIRLQPSMIAPAVMPGASCTSVYPQLCQAAMVNSLRADHDWAPIPLSMAGPPIETQAPVSSFLSLDPASVLRDCQEDSQLRTLAIGNCALLFPDHAIIAGAVFVPEPAHAILISATPTDSATLSRYGAPPAHPVLPPRRRTHLCALLPTGGTLLLSRCPLSVEATPGVQHPALDLLFPIPTRRAEPAAYRFRYAAASARVNAGNARGNWI